MSGTLHEEVAVHVYVVNSSSKYEGKSESNVPYFIATK